jgi:arylsulfatase A-like enzyme
MMSNNAKECGRIRRGLIVLMAALGLTGATVRATVTEPRPNLVIFISDDHSLKDSSAYGARDIKTPNMERLASAGMTFNRAFAASPSCAPSRAVVLTGLMPARNGAEPNHSAPRPEIKKLPAYFKELGYEVVAFGKVGHYNQTTNYGFDHCEHCSFHDDEAVPAALKWLRQRKSGKPLCLFVGSNWPHVPWPKDLEGQDPQAVMVPGNQVDTPVTHQARARYYAAITRMDTELGQVYDLACEVLGTNTCFLHFSDQGAQWPFGKWCLYDDGIRTPMFAVWPGRIAPGTRSDAMICLSDVLPTLVEAAGGKAPAELDGRSFMGVLQGRTNRHRDRIFATHSGDGNFNVYPSRCVRDEHWKFILNLHPEYKFMTHITKNGDGAAYWRSWVRKAESDSAAAGTVHRYEVRPREELYDLDKDPMELHNLAAEPACAETVKSLREELKRWMAAQGDKEKVYGQPTMIQ